MKETNLPEKEYFEPSTIENIDKSVLEYIKKLNLHAQTNEGFKPVPIMWGTSERSYVSKGEGSIRDSQGMLKLPIMSIKRTGFTKPAASKGIFQGNVPEHGDHKGGSLVVSRVINQEKTNNFAKADGSVVGGGAEVYGFTGIGSNLQVRTTNKGADNITGAQYDAFEQVMFAPSGITFSINSSGNLIATI